MSVFSGSSLIVATILGGILTVSAAGTARADAPAMIGVPMHIIPLTPENVPQPLPDIVVTNEGSNSQGFSEFGIANRGNADTGRFHVAVIAGANSDGFDIPDLAPGQKTTHTLSFNDCSGGAVVIANVFNTLKVSSSAGESISLPGLCSIDGGGSAGVPAGG
jgi:hypothetical protein